MKPGSQHVTPPGPWRLIAKRTLAVWPLVAVAFGAVLLAATLLAAAPMYAGAAAQAGLERKLADAEAETAGVDVTSRADVDGYAAQSRRVVAQLSAALPGEAPIHRVGESDSVAAGERRYVLAFFDGIEREATLRRGRWPRAGTDELEAVVSTRAAATTGLATGDTVALEGNRTVAPVSVRIVGEYDVSDPAATIWWNDELVLDGVRGTRRAHVRAARGSGTRSAGDDGALPGELAHAARPWRFRRRRAPLGRAGRRPARGSTRRRRPARGRAARRLDRPRPPARRGATRGRGRPHGRARPARPARAARGLRARLRRRAGSPAPTARGHAPAHARCTSTLAGDSIGRGGGRPRRRGGPRRSLGRAPRNRARRVRRAARSRAARARATSGKAGLRARDPRRARLSRRARPALAAGYVGAGASRSAGIPRAHGPRHRSARRGRGGAVAAPRRGRSRGRGRRRARSPADRRAGDRDPRGCGARRTAAASHARLPRPACVVAT